MADPTNPEKVVINSAFTTALVAGSSGVELQIESDVSLTAQTVVLVVVRPNGLREQYAATVSVDGTFAWYVTDGSEFPVPGSYEVMLAIEVPTTSPQQYTYSVPIPVTVVARL